ncbi:MAG: hypothetical protein ACYC2Y_10230 [Armatimonadota bacterium]
MEKYLSLSYDEATALLEMSLFTYFDGMDEASNSALAKLGDLWREFCSEDSGAQEINIAHKLARAA